VHKHISLLPAPPFFSMLFVGELARQLNCQYESNAAVGKEHGNNPFNFWYGFHAHLSMKEGSLFCSYEIHRIGMLQIVFLMSLESS
jgi:hypothetical protein